MYTGWEEEIKSSLFTDDMNERKSDCLCSQINIITYVENEQKNKIPGTNNGPKRPPWAPAPGPPAPMLSPYKAVCHCQQ